MPGKESVVLDLKTDEGRKIIYELIAKADVFVHNFRPGVPDRLGVDYDTLRAMNDRLIYVYGSCYGSVGPWAHLPGFHSSPNAIGGTGVIEAGIGNPPQNRTFGDPAGALVLAASIQVALHARQSTGRGQYVEGTMLGSLAYAVSHYSVTGGDFVRPPLVSSDQQGFGPWCRLYGTTDGQLLLCCPRPSEREALRGALARYDGDLSGSGWPQEEGTLHELLGRIFQLESASTWEKLLLDADVPAVRADDVNLFDFMLRSEQMRANDLSIEDDIEGVGRIWRGSGSVDFSGAPLRIASPVPLGHDTDRILAELGYSAEDIAALHTQGVTQAVGQGLS
jgi:crotonobetainyl-CoA:carnitine CoA-transferase CaiB-like acyl-CoA transferase